jgi:hypothetical protein
MSRFDIHSKRSEHMGITMIAGGPIDEYLHATSKDRGAFDKDVAAGDPAATSIFAAEVIYKAISDLTEEVEEILEVISSGKG